MTPVQASTIPLFLSNKVLKQKIRLICCLICSVKDVCVEATTGSGKTLAFGIPIFEILNKLQTTSIWHKFDIGALVLAPTRLNCVVLLFVDAYSLVQGAGNSNI